jgi:hypothetical protein
VEVLEGASCYGSWADRSFSFTVKDSVWTFGFQLGNWLCWFIRTEGVKLGFDLGAKIALVGDMVGWPMEALGGCSEKNNGVFVGVAVVGFFCLLYKDSGKR